MVNLQPVDKLEIWILIDNSDDNLSTAPDNVLNEFARLGEEGKTLAGEHLCCAQHGLSLLLIAQAADKTHALLFDAGPEGETLLRNCQRLAVNVGDIEAIVLSHGHWDHSGGLLEMITKIKNTPPQRSPLCYVNSGMFHTRGLRNAAGKVYPMADIPSIQSLIDAGAKVINSSDARLLLDDMFYLSGEIPRVTAYELGLTADMRKMSDNSWQPDPWISDERFLAVNIRDKGIMIFTACSHAGLINILLNAQTLFPNVPLYGVIGGFHLSGAAMEQRIAATVQDLKQFNLQVIIPSHCTGWHAVSALAQEFTDKRVVPSGVGKKFYF